jgi:peptide/nickel transport system permease protein
VATRETNPDVISSGAGLAAAVAVESGPELREGLEPVRAKGYWEQVWTRFKRDKAAIAGGITIIIILLAGFVGAPIAAHLLGHGPDDQFSIAALNLNTLLPVGPWTHVATQHGSTLFVLGGDSQLGRDEFLRLLYGTQVSMEVAIGATALSMLIGVLCGAMAGYFGGWLDTGISRLTDIVMAFPILLFIIAVASTVGPRLNSLTLGGAFQPGVVTLVLILGFFGWYYPARIVRASVLSLREKEFVEAARMVGASDARIIRSHLLPHLLAPIIVLFSITIAQFILAEAGLSALGVGIPDPVPSWGSLLGNGPTYYLTQPWLMVWPGLAILIATLAFNLFGDGLRDAFDPRSTR